MYVGPWQEYKLMKVIEQVKAENTRLKSSQIAQHNQRNGGAHEGSGGGDNGGEGFYLTQNSAGTSSTTRGGGGGGVPSYQMPTRRTHSGPNSGAVGIGSHSLDGRSQGSAKTNGTVHSTASAPPGLMTRPGGEGMYNSSKQFRHMVDPETSKTRTKQPVLARNAKKKEYEAMNSLENTGEDRAKRRTMMAMMYASEPGEVQQQQPIPSGSIPDPASRYTNGNNLQGRRGNSRGGGASGLGPNVVSALQMANESHMNSRQRPLNQSVISEIKQTQGVMPPPSQQQPQHQVPWDDPVPTYQQQLHHYTTTTGAQPRQRPTSRPYDYGAPVQPAPLGATLPSKINLEQAGHGPLTSSAGGGRTGLQPPPQAGRRAEQVNGSSFQPTAIGTANFTAQQQQPISSSSLDGRGPSQVVPPPPPVAPMNPDLLSSHQGRLQQSGVGAVSSSTSNNQPPPLPHTTSTPRTPPKGTMGMVNHQSHIPLASDGSPVNTSKRERPMVGSSGGGGPRISPAGFLEDARLSPLPNSRGGGAAGAGRLNASLGSTRLGAGDRGPSPGVSVDASQDVGSLLNWANNLEVPDF